MKMEKPSINGGKSIVVQRKRQMEVTTHPEFPWHSPLVGIGSKGVPAHPWIFCHAMVGAMEALDKSMEAFGAKRGGQRLSAASVDRFANIGQRR